MKINIKPLSVNECWQGRRFKTAEYKDYEKELCLRLPKINFQFSRRIKLDLKVGVSNVGADLDNILKPLIDILQKRYLFNDKYIYKLIVEKEKVKKGCEYIKFHFTNI